MATEGGAKEEGGAPHSVVLFQATQGCAVGVEIRTKMLEALRNDAQAGSRRHRRVVCRTRRICRSAADGGRVVVCAGGDRCAADRYLAVSAAVRAREYRRLARDAYRDDLGRDAHRDYLAAV